MDWMKTVGGLIEQATGAGADPNAIAGHFDQAAQAAPHGALADAVSGMMRSSQTPDFGQLLSGLFSGAQPHQQAGLLNTILTLVGPQLVAQVLGGHGMGNLAGMLTGGAAQVTPEQASQVPPNAMGEIGARAMEANPSVVEQVSGFVASHPDLLKSLGPSVLSSVLSGLGGR